MFNIGDVVVYGGSGICRIKDITTIDMEGIPKDRMYYILNPENRKGGLIYAPKENNKTVMRKIMNRKEAEDLISSIPEIEPLSFLSAKERESVYREYIKSCDGRRLVTIIKTLKQRGRSRTESGKKASSLDNRYLKQAEENLFSELAIPLGIPKDDVAVYISEMNKKSEKAGD